MLPAMAKKHVTPLEDVLRTNVQRLLDKHYGGKAHRLHDVHKHIALSKVQRIVDDGGCTVATLGPLADALEVEPYQLLLRDLDVNDPQTAVSATQLSRALDHVKANLHKGDPRGEADREGKKSS